MEIKKHVPIQVRHAYRSARDYMKYQIARNKLRYMVFPRIHFFDDTDVLNQIITEGKSLARFGDGEFMWLMNIERRGTFQHANERLALRLSEVVKTTDKRMIIGALKVLDNDTEYNLDALMFWLPYKLKFYKKILQFLDPNKTYADTNITRPYIGYTDKSGAEERFRSFRRIWDGKRVLIVEGDQTRIGVGNDLLTEALHIRRIICPARNAFDRYDEILQAIATVSKDSDLVLLALGPTATVLAYDLCRKGIQAIDIGHIDVEYGWLRMGARKKVKIKGRFVQECLESGDHIDDIDDEAYRNSIVSSIL